MGPQIRLIQNNDTMMAEKIQTTLVNTIPLWKNQMVLSLGMAQMCIRDRDLGELFGVVHTVQLGAADQAHPALQKQMCIRDSR